MTALLGLALASPLGASQAFAQLPDDAGRRLVMVTADTRDEIDQLQSKYDVGYVGEPTEAAVYLNDAEEGVLRAEGYTIGETIADRNTWLARKAEIAATDEAERKAREYAVEGAPAAGKAKGAVAPPGETVIMRAYTFTNYAGKFLYVEAHNKATTPTTGPVLTMAYAGPDGVFRTGVNINNSAITPDGNDSASTGNKLVDAGQYMYHRILLPLRGDDANLKASDITVRVAASTGSVDTSSVKEWAGAELPTRAGGFLKDFITKYMDPTEAYGRLDALAAEFPDIAEIVPLPEKSPGYQRPAMAMMAGTTASGSNPATANQPLAVQLFSKAMGHLGGNLISAEFKHPGSPSSALGVTVTGNDIVVNLATDAAGAPSSTAAQVVAAINGSEAASALVTAYTYAGNAGAGIVPVRAKVQLSDFLAAPPSVQRGPFPMRVMRIGKHRDGTKTGVFIYCEQHAREWVTPITCVETAERLVRNYAIDPTTKAYVDNLDIFILPSVNPDGSHYSFYDSSVQRKNLVDYCPVNAASGAIGGRNNWGVDLNRNNSVGSLFDGYSGASTNCTNETYSGPFEQSEPEIRNEHWLVDTFPKIKFAINIHTHGGYFMWAPGSYVQQGRVTLPAPNIGIENYFFDVADEILSHIRSSRGTVILPQRTGPIADVLYSAAGNSADDQWYRKGIVAYSFEAGAQRISVNQTTGAVTRTNVGFQPCFGGPGTNGGQGSTCGTVTTPNPLLVNEGHDSAMEFAEGNYGLLQGAYEFSQDATPPVTTLDSGNVTVSNQPIAYRFTWPGESAVIRYTTDGSTPNADSPQYQNQGARRPGEVLTVGSTGKTTVKWFGTDMKGNVEAVRSQTFLIEQTPPSVTIANPVDGAVYTQGRPVPVSFACADEAGGSGVADCVGSTANGATLPTDTPGTFTFTVTSHDVAGNVTTATRSYTVIPAVNTSGNTSGTVPATLSLTLGAAASFGPFTPGLAHDYTAGTTATLISTAGDALLSVADPSAVATGHLVNGSFSLPQLLQARVGSAAFAPVGGSAAPTPLLALSNPVSNGVQTVDFKQSIGATDALRTGPYSKTLTFTLSTTAP
ncbi:M14 family zinc carboxypeptidase [Solirubrobacter ginsenosidimutans]|uniref:Zinc carboxypeptidase n=1 Tax=Solirubrobacter ginsenosidimutans TaxID=490573 RepID=A0A9X3MXQ5_9ACTN|nr:M14 family zinc carboxypeptidase [Solirubrobacter ginsenosidimutans]MDA0163250.1 M14 family zinc carboxypeptidase [Solirubrobacter ginsenosidimutans]